MHSDIGGSYNLANASLLKAGKEKDSAEIREVKCVGSYKECTEAQEKLIAQGYNKWDLVIHAVTDNLIFRDTYRLYAFRKIDGLEYSRESDEEKIVNRGNISDLAEDMANLMQDGWYKNSEGKTPQIEVQADYWSTLAKAALKGAMSPASLVVDSSTVSGKLVVKRYGITSAYCYIPLKYMVEQSRKMALDIDAKLDQRIKITLDQIPGLNDVDAALSAYMGKKGKTGSKPSDWTNIKEAEKHCPQIKELRNKHLHMSSAFNTPIMEPGFTPRFEGNLRRRFYYEG